MSEIFVYFFLEVKTYLCDYERKNFNGICEGFRNVIIKVAFIPLNVLLYLDKSSVTVVIIYVYIHVNIWDSETNKT